MEFENFFLNITFRKILEFKIGSLCNVANLKIHLTIFKSEIDLFEKLIMNYLKLIMMNELIVDDIDHIEIFVSDRMNAAKWYGDVFGLHPLAELDVWSENGPLFIGNDERTVKIALINGIKENDGSINRMAFRTSGKMFVDFLTHIDDLKLLLIDVPVSKDDVVDHDISFSIYFDDPDGNKLELTCYDHDEIKSKLLVNVK